MSVPQSHDQDRERHRDGVQATIEAHGGIAIDHESEAGWSEVRLNFTSAEARQLAPC